MSALDDYRAEMVRRITAAVRAADKNFEQSGGSSRHWVAECLLPELEGAGLEIVDKATAAEATQTVGLRNIARDYAAQRDAECAGEAGAVRTWKEHDYVIAQCANRKKHTEMPGGYVEFIELAEEKMKTHEQQQCPVCGYWVIWVRREP